MSIFNVETKLKWNGEAAKIAAKEFTNKSVFEAGKIVEGQAVSLQLPDTGRLRGSITTKTKTQGTDMRAPAQREDEIRRPVEDQVAFVGTNVYYAPYVEFGTVKQSAKPFLRPALDLNTGKILQVYEIEGRKELRRAE
jgi:HK97 gp10 family phage protein